MQMAQDVTSMVLALRRKVNIKVRQPLQCIMIPVVDEEQRAHIEAVKALIMNLVANEGKLTVALEVTVTEELRREGIARELVNRIQNIRKSSGFEITDKIKITLSKKSSNR